VLRPDPVASRRENPVGIDRILDRLVKTSQRVVAEQLCVLDSSMGFSVSRLVLTKFQLLRTAAPTEPEVVTEAEPEIAVQSTPLSLAAAHAIGSNGEGQSSV